MQLKAAHTTHTAVTYSRNNYNVTKRTHAHRTSLFVSRLDATHALNFSLV